MLELIGVDASYGKVQALRGVSLRVGTGEMVALLGANGAGKTTTLRAISGQVAVHGGRVEFDGADITGCAPERTAAMGIAHIPQGRGIFSEMTVWQNLKMGGFAQRLKTPVFTSRAEEVLDIFPRLRDRIDQVAGTMSGGEQQMLAIGRALIGAPRLLMLDEPSHGLAPKIVEDVFVLLSKLAASGVGLLIVEQYAATALKVVHRGYVLERGRVSVEGEAEALLRDRRSLVGAYLGASQ